MNKRMLTLRQALYDGESYELCLTTMLTAKQQVHPLSLYRTLRRMNPAPYAAWLSFGDELQVRALNVVPGTKWLAEELTVPRQCFKRRLTRVVMARRRS